MGVVLLPSLYRGFSQVPSAVLGPLQLTMARALRVPVALWLLGLCWSLAKAHPL